MTWTRHNVMTLTQSVQLIIHSHYHHLVFSVTVTVLLKIFIHYPDLTSIIKALKSFSISDSVLIMILLLIPFWYPFFYRLLNDIRSVIDSLLIFFHNEIKHITSKTSKGSYVKLHEWSLQPFVSKPLIYPNWDFLIKLSQSVYRRGCGLDESRVGIPVK